MPPIANKLLEERILKTAERLWRTRGEPGLTLRVVAREASTTTPTVYKRFRNKQALMLALAERFRAHLNEQLFASPSLDEVCRRYIRYVEDHPREYQLLWHTWSEIFHPAGPRPGRTWLLGLLAARFGGQPEDYARTFYALFLITHGSASLLTVPETDEAARAEVRENCLEICDIVLKNIAIFRD